MEDSKQGEKIEKAIIGLSEAMLSLVDVIEEQDRKRREEKEDWNKACTIGVRGRNPMNNIHGTPNSGHGGSDILLILLVIVATSLLGVVWFTWCV